MEWSRYKHPCLFDQSLIPGLLLQIVRGDEKQRLAAADELWHVTAHQGNVGPSAVPTAGFLLEMLEEMPGSVQAAILEILFHFASYCKGESWSTELRSRFFGDLPLLKQLSVSTNQDVSEYSNMIIEKLQADD